MINMGCCGERVSDRWCFLTSDLEVTQYLFRGYTFSRLIYAHSNYKTLSSAVPIPHPFPLLLLLLAGGLSSQVLDPLLWWWSSRLQGVCIVSKLNSPTRHALTKDM